MLDKKCEYSGDILEASIEKIEIQLSKARRKIVVEKKLTKKGFKSGKRGCAPPKPEAERRAEGGGAEEIEGTKLSNTLLSLPTQVLVG